MSKFKTRHIVYCVFLIIFVPVCCWVITQPRERDAKPHEIEMYHQYMPQIEAVSGEYIDEILKHCVFVKEDEETEADKYASYDLEEYLNGCKNITALLHTIYCFEINYTTVAQWQVSLLCDDNGVYSMSVYDPVKHVLFIDNYGECSVYKNFKLK